MSIRNKLTLRFAGIFALLLILFSLTVYYFTSIYRQREFFDSTRERALATAHMVLEADEVTPAKHQNDLKMYYRVLPAEVVRIFDLHGKVVFADGKDSLLVSRGFMNQVRS